MKSVEDHLRDAFSGENSRKLAELETRAVELRQQLWATEAEIKRIRDSQSRALQARFNNIATG